MNNFPMAHQNNFHIYYNDNFYPQSNQRDQLYVYTSNRCNYIMQENQHKFLSYLINHLSNQYGWIFNFYHPIPTNKIKDMKTKYYLYIYRYYICVKTYINHISQIIPIICIIIAQCESRTIWIANLLIICCLLLCIDTKTQQQIINYYLSEHFYKILIYSLKSFMYI